MRGRGLADHTTDVRWVGVSIAAHRNRFPVPSRACAPQGADPAKPADHHTLLPNPAAHNPATRVIASQSSARHQGAEQRKRGREAHTATHSRQALPGWVTRSRPSARQHRLAKVRTGEEDSSSRLALPSSSTRHPRGACRDKAMRRRSASTTDDRLLTPRLLDPTHNSRLVTDDSNSRTSPRSPGAASDSLAHTAGE